MLEATPGVLARNTSSLTSRRFRGDTWWLNMRSTGGCSFQTPWTTTPNWVGVPSKSASPSRVSFFCYIHGALQERHPYCGWTNSCTTLKPWDSIGWDFRWSHDSRVWQASTFHLFLFQPPPTTTTGPLQRRRSPGDRLRDAELGGSDRRLPGARVSGAGHRQGCPGAPTEMLSCWCDR